MDPKVTTETARFVEKRAYSKPELVEYGNVRELTRGASTKSLDFMSTTRQIV